MYFIFSKILLFILFPLNWVIAFLVIAFFSKRPNEKELFIAGLTVADRFHQSVLLYLFAKRWDIWPAVCEKGKVYSAVIVLGGFSGEDKNGKAFLMKRRPFYQGP